MTAKELADMLRHIADKRTLIHVENDTVILCVPGGELVFHNLTDFGTGQVYFNDSAD